MISRDFLLECEQYIKNGGILSGAAFTHAQIPKQELIEVDPLEVEDYLATNRNLVFAQQLFSCRFFWIIIT